MGNLTYEPIGEVFVFFPFSHKVKTVGTRSHLRIFVQLGEILNMATKWFLAILVTLMRSNNINGYPYVAPGCHHVSIQLFHKYQTNKG